LKELPQRKNQRLRGCDYSQNGRYSVTFCTHNRNSYLGRIYDENSVIDKHCYKFVLNQNGLLLDEVIKCIPDRFENIIIDQYCIMPNHVHFIFSILDDSSVLNNEIMSQSDSIGIAPKKHRSLISKIIGYVKMNSAKHIRINNPAIPGVWQRGYNDHIFRNDKEYKAVCQYIKQNVQRWEEDVFYYDDTTK
jgi:putative transposase